MPTNGHANIKYFFLICERIFSFNIKCSQKLGTLYFRIQVFSISPWLSIIFMFKKHFHPKTLIPHQKLAKRFRKENGWMNRWLVYVPDVLDWKLDKALMDSKLLFWDISIRSMSKTNYQFGSRLYLRKQKKCIFRLFDQNNKHEHQLKIFFSWIQNSPTKNICHHIYSCPTFVPLPKRNNVYRFTNICKILAQESFDGWRTLI